MTLTLHTRAGLALGLPIGWLLVACGSAPARDVQLQTTFRVEPGTERYECYRLDVDDDVFTTRIASTAAPGVHHQILAIAEQGEPEGAAECGSVLLNVSESWIFLANRNPLDFALPAGVAYQIPEGSQLVLQTHLFNGGDTAIDSTLTVDLTGIAEDDVGARAQLVQAGSLGIDLPAGMASTVTGTCTFPEDVSVFSVLPHMHFLGTTFKTWISGAGEDAILYDGEFFGETQQFERFEPVAMPAGAQLNVQCDYFNGTGDRVIYGSSARDEMCFAITYYYPAIDGQSPLCLR